MVTFEVENVVPNANVVFKTVNGREQSSTLVQYDTVEAFSHTDTDFVELSSFIQNPLIAAVHTAFAKHLGVIFSPDMIWLVIMQGVSQHVATGSHSEKYRNVFVAHKDKIDLKILDNNLIKGSWKQNDRWVDIVQNFSNQVSEHLSGESAQSTLNTTFSTTGKHERIAQIMTFMDICKHYFTYTVCTECGISDIELLGNKQDWVKIRDSLSILDELELTEWKVQLQKLLQKFIDVFDDKVDLPFWQNIYKKNSGRGSGSPVTVTGWINKLFLYKADGELNLNATNHASAKCSLTPDEFPVGLTNTPFCWEYLKQIYNMTFTAGFVGVVNLNNMLKPQVGWFVAEIGKSPKEQDIAYEKENAFKWTI